MRVQHSKYLDFLSKLGIGGAHPGGINLTREIFKREKIPRNTRILDVGCGTGQTAAYLASQYGAKVIGIDNNPLMVANAKKRMHMNRLPVEIIHTSIDEIPFPDNYFDFIISESVLSFVHKPQALQEIYRLLKKNGRFIAIEHTLIQKLTKKERKEILHFYGFHSLHTKAEWIALIEQAGFQEIRIQKNATIDSVPEIANSNANEPELYEMMKKHFELLTKYERQLGYRIYSCTK